MKAKYKNCDNTYKDYACVANVINYLAKENSSLYGQGCSAEPEQAIRDFRQVQGFYSNRAEQYLRHYIISFRRNLSVDDPFIISFADYAARYFSGEFQVFYSIQNDNGHIHIHFVVNTTSFRTGKALVCNRYENEKYLSYLNNYPEVSVDAVNSYY